MITLEPRGFDKLEKATSERAVRMQAFFAKRGGVIMTNALRNMSYSWRTEQQNEMQRIFDRPSKFTLSAPRVNFNQRLLAGGPLGDQHFTAGSRSSLRYENQAIWKLDDSRGTGSTPDLTAGYLRPHILGTRSYDGKTQQRLDRYPDFEGRRMVPHSPNPPYTGRRTPKGRPVGGIYSSVLQSMALIGPGAIGPQGRRNRKRQFFFTTPSILSFTPLPAGIYGERGRGGRLIGLFFHLAKPTSRHNKRWHWSAVTRRHIDEAWPRLFRAQFARQLHAASKATGRTLPPAP